MVKVQLSNSPLYVSTNHWCCRFYWLSFMQAPLGGGSSVIGLDNLNSYYSVALKRARIAELHAIASTTKSKFTLFESSIENYQAVRSVFEDYGPEKVVNLAAQAGVRHSIENPSVYIQSNLVGFGNILECCRQYDVKNLLYASSSSVYGGNTNLPFSEIQGVDHPVSLYAATKKANELMAHTYSHLYGLSAID